MLTEALHGQYERAMQVEAWQLPGSFGRRQRSSAAVLGGSSDPQGPLPIFGPAVAWPIAAEGFERVLFFHR